MIKSTDIVYITGPMTGLPDFNRAAFNAAERMLRELGCTVLNPARQPDGLEYEEYIRRGLEDVEAANVIVLLPGWNHSPGAIRELARAIQMGLRVEIFNGSEFPNSMADSSMSGIVVLIKERMFGIPLRVVVGDYEYYQSICAKRYGFEYEPQKHYGGECLFARWRDKGIAENVIWLPSFSFINTWGISTLSHECIHAAMNVIDLVGNVKVEKGNEHCFAYLHQFYFCHSMNALKEKEKQNGK